MGAEEGPYLAAYNQKFHTGLKLIILKLWTGFGGGFCGGLHEHEPHSQSQSDATSWRWFLLLKKSSSPNDFDMHQALTLYCGRGLGTPPIHVQFSHSEWEQSGHCVPHEALLTSRLHWQHLNQGAKGRKIMFIISSSRICNRTREGVKDIEGRVHILRDVDIYRSRVATNFNCEAKFALRNACQ